MSDFPKPASSAPHLLNLISQKKLDPSQLTPHQRRICVRFLLQEGKHAQHEIAAILKVREQVISKDKKKIRAQNTWMLDEIDERKIAVGILRSAELFAARLSRGGKYRDAWAVQKECVEVLQNLGYLKRAPIELKGQVTLQEILKLAISGEDGAHPVAIAGNGSSGALTNGSG